MATATVEFTITTTGADQAEANQKLLTGGKDFCKSKVGLLDSALFGQESQSEATIDGWSAAQVELAIQWFVNFYMRHVVKTYRRDVAVNEARATEDAKPDWIDDAPVE